MTSPLEPHLYLHVGLPKTGTTYLQEAVFPFVEGLRFLNKPKSDLLAGPPAPMYGILDRAFKRSALVWDELGDEIFESLLGAPRERYRPDRPVLISDEGISTGGRTPALLAAHLVQVRRIAQTWGFRSLRILCTFRRQDQWLASHYAQISRRIRGASQEAFEHFVREWIDPHEGFYRDGVLLDYCTLREHLISAVGRENLALVPYELMEQRPSAFLAEIAEFMRLAENGFPESRASGSERRNVRSSTPDAWVLRPLESRRSIHLRPHRLLRTLGLPTRLPLRSPDFRRSDTIRLTDELKAEVLRRYDETNRALARALDLDLKRLGYYGDQTGAHEG